MQMERKLMPLREGIATLRVNPMRTALSMLGVVIGVASMVAVLAVGDGMERFLRGEMQRTTDVQNVAVSPVRADTVDDVLVPRDHWRMLTAEDARRAAREVPGAAAVSVSVSGTTLLTPPLGGRRRGARVTAALPGLADMYSLDLDAGRFFTEMEAERNVPVAVVSHEVARVMSPDGTPESMLGLTLRMRGAPFKVIGVLAAPRGGERALSAYVPLRAAGAVMPPAQAAAPRTLVLRASRVEDVPRLLDAVQNWMAVRYGRWEKDFTVGTDKSRVEQMMQGMLMFKLFMGALTAISLLVGGIGIMNVLLASVTERTHEIGIRKAAGAQRSDILVQFLAESLAISGSGSALGLVLGLLGAVAVTAVMRAQTEAGVHAVVSAGTLAAAAVSALAVGLTFGTYPARRAARLSPIEAIRHE